MIRTKVNAVVAYTGVAVDRPPYKHFEDNKRELFLADFPHGKIPAFKSNKGLTIFEGTAIARYSGSFRLAASKLCPKLIFCLRSCCTCPGFGPHS